MDFDGIWGEEETALFLAINEEMREEARWFEEYKNDETPNTDIDFSHDDELSSTIGNQRLRPFEQFVKDYCEGKKTLDDPLYGPSKKNNSNGKVTTSCVLMGVQIDGANQVPEKLLGILAHVLASIPQISINNIIFDTFGGPIIEGRPVHGTFDGVSREVRINLCSLWDMSKEIVGMKRNHLRIDTILWTAILEVLFHECYHAIVPDDNSYSFDSTSDEQATVWAQNLIVTLARSIDIEPSEIKNTSFFGKKIKNLLKIDSPSTLFQKHLFDNKLIYFNNAINAELSDLSIYYAVLSGEESGHPHHDALHSVLKLESQYFDELNRNSKINDGDMTQTQSKTENSNLIKIAGVTFNNRQSVCKKLNVGNKLSLVKEPNNPYDEYAVKVFYNNEECGYIPKDISYAVSNLLESNTSKWEAVVRGIDGVGEKNIGIIIELIEAIKENVTLENNNFQEVVETDYNRSNHIDDWVDNDSFEEEIDKDINEEIKLTEEQLEILEYELSEGSVLKIIAFAGTGKTTTLLEYAKLRPNSSFLYVAFNKSIQTEAEKKFPFNVTCKTSHSLAYKEIGYKYRSKLIPNLRLNDIARYLEIQDYSLVKLVFDTLSNFLSSSDTKFIAKHLTVRNLSNKNFGKKILNLAAKLFLSMKDENDRNIGMTHDGYLKLYQLSKPILNYDYILLDEAQDTTPCVSDIIINQKCKKIFVGDPHQQIYTFRGAENAMDKIDSDETLYLTNSFRFTSEIAGIGTKILRDFKSEKRAIVGKADEANKSKHINDFAYICRTNAKVFEIAAFLNDQKLYFVGGIQGYKFNDLKDILYLKEGLITKIQNKYIGSFRSYANLLLFIRETDDIELNTKTKIIDKYGSSINSMIENIYNRTVDKKNADIILSTAHKAKGSEFYRIKIADDFPPLVKEGKLVDFGEYEQDEFNLQYVAVTRAMFEIDYEDQYQWDLYLKTNICNNNFEQSSLQKNNAIRRYFFNDKPVEVETEQICFHDYDSPYEDECRNTFDENDYKYMLGRFFTNDISILPKSMFNIQNNFTNLSSSVVIDHSTSLMWLNSDFEIINDCDNLNSHINDKNAIMIEGYYDWRLPTVQELFSLYSVTISNEICNEKNFLYKLKDRVFWSCDSAFYKSNYDSNDYENDDDHYFSYDNNSNDSHYYEGKNNNFLVSFEGSFFPLLLLDNSADGYVKSLYEKKYALLVRNNICQMKTQSNFETIIIPFIDYPMIYIPPGKFNKGCEFINQCFSIDNHQPTEISLTKGFFIGLYPITSSQYSSILNDYIEEKDDDEPAIVIFTKILKFLDLLSDKIKNVTNNSFTFVLPTEAEWEYFCQILYNSKLSFNKINDNSSHCIYRQIENKSGYFYNDEIIRQINSLGIGNILEHTEFTRDQYVYNKQLRNLENSINPAYPYDLEEGYDCQIVSKGGLLNDENKYCPANFRCAGTYSWQSDAHCFRLLIYGNKDEFSYLNYEYAQKCQKIIRKKDSMISLNDSKDYEDDIPF